MSITVEEAAARLEAEALRRGVTTEQLLDELARQDTGRSGGGKRFAFAGLGHSGLGDFAERHKQARDDLLSNRPATDE